MDIGGIKHFLAALVEELRAGSLHQTSSRIELELANLLGVERYKKILLFDGKMVIVNNEVNDFVDIHMEESSAAVKDRVKSILFNICCACMNNRQYMKHQMNLYSLVMAGHLIEDKTKTEKLVDEILGGKSVEV